MKSENHHNDSRFKALKISSHKNIGAIIEHLARDKKQPNPTPLSKTQVTSHTTRSLCSCYLSIQYRSPQTNEVNLTRENCMKSENHHNDSRFKALKISFHKNIGTIIEHLARDKKQPNPTPLSKTQVIFHTTRSLCSC